MSDRINDWEQAPDYYRFPDHVQVVDISEHLTSNGGQIVQYVARSTRLDGNNKGEQIKDLAKARRLLKREILRLEEIQRLEEIRRLEVDEGVDTGPRPEFKELREWPPAERPQRHDLSSLGGRVNEWAENLAATEVGGFPQRFMAGVEAADREAMAKVMEAFGGTAEADPSDGPWADGACDCGGD